MNGVPVLKGNIRHAVCRWCFSEFSLDGLCQAALEIGISGIDLTGPADWPVLKQYGLISSMCNGAEISLTEGFNHREYHSELIKRYKEMIPLVANAGYKNLICFSGNRNGMDDETGLQNCVEGLRQLLPLAERSGVTLVMELLNAGLDHPDYHCNSSAWGAELVDRSGSENFKLLYDIYHMQVDEGNVISTIRRYKDYIAHFHTAGVPGRHEIDETQELNYPAIMRAIRDTGFSGFVAQEFVPLSEDKVGALRQAVEICDV